MERNIHLCKPIEQYDLKGNLINLYVSIKEASRQTRIDEKHIIQVAKGIYKQWNGFVWKYARQTEAVSGFGSPQI
ncbi:MAG: NUMOD1 domain-containing DNA-binding protein [Bacteroidota bacterium]|nr:NUMOD1 domain-containing DNA-binding protein [Bacteroidota bacterium]